MSRVVEVKYPLPRQAPSYATLYVNGIALGRYLGGEDKKYLNPEKWADEQIAKRTKVIDRNIARLEKELQELRKEKEVINKV